MADVARNVLVVESLFAAEQLGVAYISPDSTVPLVVPDGVAVVVWLDDEADACTPLFCGLSDERH